MAIVIIPPDKMKKARIAVPHLESPKRLPKDRRHRLSPSEVHDGDFVTVPIHMWNHDNSTVRHRFLEPKKILMMGPGIIKKRSSCGASFVGLDFVDWLIWLIRAI